MTQQPSAALKTVQIRYRIDYLTWLRMEAWAQANKIGRTPACNYLLNYALERLGVSSDPAVLLGLEEKDGG